MFNPQPIQTEYAGCLFRSRLEARWAVFFDALHIEWEYEKEGYELDGERYLPDFWFPYRHFDGNPRAGQWVEIKPTDLTRREARKMAALVKASGHRGMAICGEPWPGKCHVVVFQHHRAGTPQSVPLLRRATFVEENEHKGTEFETLLEGGDCYINLVEGDGIFTFYHPIRDPLSCGSLTRAFQAARQARFEHGEAPHLPDNTPRWHRRSA